MSNDPSAAVRQSPSAGPPQASLTVFRLAALFTFLAVAMGAVVCATGSGAGCPTWPGCRPDAITPQWQLSPMIEFTHRVVAIGAGPLVLAAALMAVRLPGADGWARTLPWVALAGAVAAGTFGRLVVLSGLPTWAGAIDLVSALTAMTVMGIATVRLGSPPAAWAARAAWAVGGGTASDGTASDGTFGGGSFGGGSFGRETVRLARWQAAGPRQLATASVVVLIGMQVAGLFAAGKGSFTRCMGWPLWQVIDGDRYVWLQGARLAAAMVAAGLVIATVAVSVRQDRLRPWGIGIGALFAAEMLLGLVIRGGGFGLGVAAAYSVIAVTLLWVLGLLAAVARVERFGADAARPEAVSV